NTMDSPLFDELQATYQAEGAAAAVERLCSRLREKKDFTSLFYALLMKKRQELGVSPIPTGPAQDLPREAHAPYEEAIRSACRHVGNLCLEQGDIPQAWVYFRMIGEPQPVVEALDRRQIGEGDDAQQLVHIAFYENVHPKKGFDWILQRFGICNAITTLGSQELPHSAEVKEYCVKQLVRSLYAELRERLLPDIEHHEGKAPPATQGIRELLQGRDWLFESDFAHIDTSHLGAVVQMSIHLPPCEELELARELCEYGQRLARRLQYRGDPPFDDQYKDYGVYLAALAGE